MSIKYQTFMYICRKIKNWFKATACEHECKAIAEELFDFCVKGDKVYILCQGKAVKSLPTNATIDEIKNEISNLVSTAIEYEKIRYEI